MDVKSASFSTDNGQTVKIVQLRPKNISITLLQIALKLHEHRGHYCRKIKAPVNDFGRTVPGARIYMLLQVQ